MFRNFETRGGGTKTTVKSLDVHVAHRLATIVANITSGSGRAAVRTDTLKIPVRKEALAARTIGLRHVVPIKVTLTQ
jgi:hypothetical protein